MEDREFNYINVIPFVDVMLVLLTIVLTTSTFIATGAIAVTLPKASSTQGETLNRQTISIDQNGEIYFNAAKMALTELSATVHNIDKETPMVIRADCHIKLQIFIDVLDLLNSNGFQKVAIQTERQK